MLGTSTSDDLHRAVASSTRHARPGQKDTDVVRETSEFPFYMFRAFGVGRTFHTVLESMPYEKLQTY
jgi:hypothetical protein